MIRHLLPPVGVHVTTDPRPENVSLSRSRQFALSVALDISALDSSLSLLRWCCCWITLPPTIPPSREDEGMVLVPLSSLIQRAVPIPPLMDSLRVRVSPVPPLVLSEVRRWYPSPIFECARISERYGYLIVV